MALFRSLETEIGRLFVLTYPESADQEKLRRRSAVEFIELVRARRAAELRSEVMAFNDTRHELVRTVLRTHPSLTAGEPPTGTDD